jgi:hypothetical protein
MRPVAEMDFAEIVHAAFQQYVTCAVATGDGHVD